MQRPDREVVIKEIRPSREEMRQAIDRANKVVSQLPPWLVRTRCDELEIDGFTLAYRRVKFNQPIAVPVSKTGDIFCVNYPPLGIDSAHVAANILHVVVEQALERNFIEYACSLDVDLTDDERKVKAEFWRLLK